MKSVRPNIGLVALITVALITVALITVALITVALITVALIIVGCVDSDESRDDVAWMPAHTTHYLDDASWRRGELEASLWRPELPYARQRLAGYALPEGGWDLLPELEAVTGPVFSPLKSAGRGSLGDFEEVFSTEVPGSREAWLELGEAIFWRMPMRRDAYLEWLVDRPELIDEVGLERNSDGSLRGIVAFRDASGAERIGATCGMCHGADGVPGRAHRALDLGLGRAPSLMKPTGALVRSTPPGARAGSTSPMTPSSIPSTFRTSGASNTSPTSTPAAPFGSPRRPPWPYALRPSTSSATASRPGRITC